MKVIIQSVCLTLLLIVQISTTSAFFWGSSGRNNHRRPTQPTYYYPLTAASTAAPAVNNASTSSVNGSFNTEISIQNSSNISGIVVSRTTRSVYEIPNLNLTRFKRDIATDILLNQIKAFAKAFEQRRNSLIGSAKIAINTDSIEFNVSVKLLTNQFELIRQSALNDLLKLATKIDINLRNCYNRNSFTFADALNLGRNIASQCLAKSALNVKAIIDDFNNQISNATLKNIIDLDQKINDCLSKTITYPNAAGELIKNLCIHNAIIEIRSNTLSIPGVISKIVNVAQDSIKSIRANIEMCALSITSAAIEESVKSYDAITKCIDESNGLTSTTIAPSTNGTTTTTIQPPTNGTIF